LAGLDGSLVAVKTTMPAWQRRISMSKGNDKKPKTGISPYKAAQSTGKPTIGALARKTGR
jgi:hypothetical protein